MVPTNFLGHFANYFYFAMQLKILGKTFTSRCIHLKLQTFF